MEEEASISRMLNHNPYYEWTWDKDKLFNSEVNLHIQPYLEGIADTELYIRMI